MQPIHIQLFENPTVYYNKIAGNIPRIRLTNKAKIIIIMENVFFLRDGIIIIYIHM